VPTFLLLNSGIMWPSVAASNLDLLSLTIFIILTIVVGVVLLLLSELLGPRRRDPEKETIYECGVPLLDSAREPFTVKFYLVAILFILFDIETVFLLPYAVVYKKLGIVGLAEMGVFLLILAGGLVYLWKRGALEWD
jgi:NADH-quinone oxidoreductase subunit A